MKTLTRIKNKANASRKLRDCREELSLIPGMIWVRKSISQEIHSWFEKKYHLLHNERRTTQAKKRVGKWTDDDNPMWCLSLLSLVISCQCNKKVDSPCEMLPYVTQRLCSEMSIILSQPCLNCFSLNVPFVYGKPFLENISYNFGAM